MPDWVRIQLNYILELSPDGGLVGEVAAGVHGVPAVGPLDPQDAETRPEDHQENHHDAQEDEGSGQEGHCLEVPASERDGHGRRL